MSPTERQDAIRPGRRLLAGVLAGLVVLVSLMMPATAATAAEIPGAITSVTTDKATYGYSERIKLSFTWAVPDSAVAGDTFSLDLPDELKATSLATFPLRAPDGQVVAWGAWSGKSIVVTLTDYADSHDGVGGSGFVTVQWDHAVVPATGAPIRLEFGSTVVDVVIDPKPAPPTPCTVNCPPPTEPTPPKTSRGLEKSGSWADGSYEGTRDQAGNINWSVRLPGSPEGFTGPISITDVIGAGSIVECATLAVTGQLTLASGAARTPVDPARYTLDCSPSGFTIVLDAIAPTEFIAITYQGTITDQALGSYGNSVAVDIPGQPTTKTVTMRRTSSGGDGDGVQRVSVGDLVWLDTDRDGLQGDTEPGIPGVVLVLTGPDGQPVRDIDGALVGPATTDADGRYGFGRLPVLRPGESYTVSIDRDASAAALRDLLPTLAESGDRALDSSTWSAVSGDLTTNGAADLTLDFGFVTPEPDVELPTLPLPEDPTLAMTGTEAAPLLATGLAAAVLGGVLLLLAPRPRTRRH